MSESTSALHRDVVGSTDPDTNNMHSAGIAIDDATDRTAITTNWAAKGRTVPPLLMVIQADTGLPYYWNGTAWAAFAVQSDLSFLVISADGTDLTAQVNQLAVGADSTHEIPTTFTINSTMKVWQSSEYTATITLPDGWTFSDGNTTREAGYGDVYNFSYYGGTVVLIDSYQHGRV